MLHRQTEVPWINHHPQIAQCIMLPPATHFSTSQTAILSTHILVVISRGVARGGSGVVTPCDRVQGVIKLAGNKYLK
jgi:hypothetical protein